MTNLYLNIAYMRILLCKRLSNLLCLSLTLSHLGGKLLIPRLQWLNDITIFLLILSTYRKIFLQFSYGVIFSMFFIIVFFTKLLDLFLEGDYLIHVFRYILSQLLILIFHPGDLLLIHLTIIVIVILKLL